MFEYEARINERQSKGRPTRVSRVSKALPGIDPITCGRPMQVRWSNHSTIALVYFVPICNNSQRFEGENSHCPIAFSIGEIRMPPVHRPPIAAPLPHSTVYRTVRIASHVTDRDLFLAQCLHDRGVPTRGVFVSHRQAMPRRLPGRDQRIGWTHALLRTRWVQRGHLNRSERSSFIIVI